MSMAIISGVVGVAGTAYGAYNQNKQAKAAKAAASGGGDYQSAYGRVPEAVDLSEAQLKAILANQAAIPDIATLVNRGNNSITNQAVKRANIFVPGYSGSMARYGANANSLLNGELPFDDVLGIVSDRAGLSGSLGIPGTAGNATLKDLGLSRLDAMKSGGGMLQDMVRMAETVSPRSSYMSPTSMMISPEMQYNAMQSKENLKATGDPAARAQLEANMTGAGIGATGTDNSGYIQAGTQLLQGILGSYGSAGGGYKSQSAMNTAAPYAAGSTWSYGNGYIPKAGRN